MGLKGVTVRQGVTESEALGLAAVLANHSLHPVSRALVVAARAHPQDSPYRCDGVEEVAGQGVRAQVQVVSGHWYPRGAVRLGAAAFCGLSADIAAGGRAHLADDDGWIASFELAEQLRADAQQTVQGLAALGVAVHLYSGDGAQAAQAAGAQLGVQMARGGLSPDGKLALVRELQASGHQVAMVGDGVNDGPVLAGAQVAIALAQGAPLVQSRSDFVVVGGSLLPVLQVVTLARKTRRIVGQNLLWAFLYNAACIPLAVLGYLPAWAAGLGMASSSLLVVLNALRLSRLPQLARSQ